MVRKKYTSFALVVGLLLFAVSFFLVAKTPLSATGLNTWDDGAADISQVREIMPEDVKAMSRYHCTDTVVPVVRKLYQELLTNNENHCMIHTTAGLVDDNLSIFMPRDQGKAYPIDYVHSGYPTLEAVPNYPSALYVQADPVYQGVDVGLYKMLSNHLTFNGNVLWPKYTLDGPDMFFKYPDRNRNMAFMSGGAFTNSGTYWVAEGVNYGFVRINMTTLQMKTFAANSQRTSSGQLLGAVAQISPSGRYAAVAYNAPQGWGSKYLKIVDIDTCSDTVAAYSAATSTCTTINYWPNLSQKIPDLNAISHVQFATDNALSFVATTGSGPTARYYLYKMSPVGQPERLEDYLGLGDSFASGEGTFNYMVGTETGINRCHLSIRSYPYLMSPHVGPTNSVACSGAKMNNITTAVRGDKNNQLKDLLDSDVSISMQDYARQNHTPGVVLQDQFLDRDNPQIITVSVGGNDVNFSDIIKRCIVPFNNGHSTSQNCYERYEDRKEIVNTINGQYGNLVQTYLSLKVGDPTRRIYVIGYPQLVSPTGDCAINVHLSQSDRVFAGQLTDYLDSVIERAAAEAGVFYVDTQHAFDGHKLCEAGDKAVNGLTAGKDQFGLIGNESYHPNKLGHELLADAILESTHNLAAPMPKPHILPALDESTLPILQAPKEGRLIYEVLNVGKDAVGIVNAGGSVQYATQDVKGLVMPDSDFSGVLHSIPVDIGTLHADTNGNLSGKLSIPATTVPGIHTIHVYGKNIFGDPIDIQQTVYVAASSTDYDGDSVPNVTDSCPGIPQSGQDVDQDGVDDACDPEIAEAPQLPPTPAYNQPANKPTIDTASQTMALQNSTSPTPRLQPAGASKSVTVTDQSNMISSTKNAVRGAATVRVRSKTTGHAHSTGLLWGGAVFAGLIGIAGYRRFARR